MRHAHTGLLLMFLAFSLPHPAGAGVASTFDRGAEGWRAACIAYDANGINLEILTGPLRPLFAGSGGNPGGHITQLDPDARTWYWMAPSSYLGNISACKGGSLRFSLFQREIDGGPFDDADVVLDAGDIVLAYNALYPPSAEWTDYTVPLQNGANWFKGDYTGEEHPTDTEFDHALANVKGIYIRGEFITGDDRGGLDTVSISEARVLESMFRETDEDWRVVSLKQGGPYATVLNGPYTPDYLYDEGDPGCHLGLNNRDNNIQYWNAPAPFRGDLSAFYGGSLRFSLKQDVTATPFNDADIVIVGDGLTLVYDTAVNPGKTWSRYIAPLSPAGWHINTLGGAAPTSAEFRQALKSVTALRIRGEYCTGANVGYLDSVTLGGPVPPITPNPVSGWSSFE